MERWSEVIDTVKKHDHEMWAVSELSDGNPIPEGARNLGRLARDQYQDILSHSKALLGIHKPEISPSPFVAL